MHIQHNEGNPAIEIFFFETPAELENVANLPIISANHSQTEKK